MDWSVSCLALDVGDRRVGVAVGQVLARPLLTLARRSKKQDFDVLARLMREHHVGTLVVGLPLNMDGTKGFQAHKVERYAQLLHAALHEMELDVELIFWDERLSTERAAQIMIDSKRGQDQQHSIDAVAAAVILQSYLDDRAGKDALITS